MHAAMKQEFAIFWVVWITIGSPWARQAQSFLSGLRPTHRINCVAVSPGLRHRLHICLYHLCLLLLSRPSLASLRCSYSGPLRLMLYTLCTFSFSMLCPQSLLEKSKDEHKGCEQALSADNCRPMAVRTQDSRSCQSLETSSTSTQAARSLDVCLFVNKILLLAVQSQILEKREPPPAMCSTFFLSTSWDITLGLRRSFKAYPSFRHGICSRWDFRRQYKQIVCSRLHLAGPRRNRLKGTVIRNWSRRFPAWLYKVSACQYWQ